MDERRERGLLTDIAIFIVIVGLALCAIYFSGNWPWFLEMLADLEAEILTFINTFTSNVQSVTDVVNNASSM